MADEIYLLAGTTLHAIQLDDGAQRVLSTGWSTVTSLAFARDRIWAMQQETLFLVRPDDGSDSVHSRGWGSGVKRLAGSGDEALLLDGRGRLFSLGQDGAYRFLSDGWEGTTALFATDGRFFAIDDGRLFELHPGTGGNRFVSDGWGDVAAAAGVGGELFLVSPRGGNVVRVNPDEHTEKIISRDWFHTELALDCCGRLVLLDGRVLFELQPDGQYRQVSEGWTEVQAATAPGT